MHLIQLFFFNFQYFASIFEVNPSPPNAMIYIVLPPELSKRSIQILIQYMYSGEATVSNDILNEVLRGGEVLKIRGLWRNNQTVEPNASSTPQYQTATSSSLTTKITDPNTAHYSIPKENLAIAEKPIYDHRSSSDRLSHTNNVSAVSKESPVIVMSPRHQLAPPPPHHLVIPSAAPLTIRKEIATDPQVMADQQPSIPSAHYGLVSLQIAAAAVKKAQHTSDKRNKQMHSPPLILSNHENGMDQLRRYSDDHQQIQKEIDLAPSSNQRILRMVDKRRQSVVDQQKVAHHLEPGEALRYPNSKTNPEKKIVAAGEMVQIPEALSFLTIKQEPIEWTEFDHENGVEKSQIEVTVKPEMLFNDDRDTDDEGKHLHLILPFSLTIINIQTNIVLEMDEHDEMIYSPLTCELCSETFTIPAEWVRHIEGHAEATQCVPKKRKRINVSAFCCILERRN